VRLKHTSFAIAPIVFVASVGYAQVSATNRGGDTPEFGVRVSRRLRTRIGDDTEVLLTFGVD
jgi:hypothetical protein